MGFVGNLFNGSRGMGWNASGTDIQQPATMGQANTAYGQTQQGLANQNAFLQALQGQNAIQNQTALTGTLQNMVQGGGPNPALAQFNRTQGQNLAGTSAAIAGARGAQANPAAAARTIASVGADANMKAATDAATLRQQQQLGAIGALGTQLGSQVTNLGGATNAYSTAAQNQQNNIYNAIAQANNARVGMQGNINNANATIANATAQGQQGLIGGLLGGVGAGLGLAATGGRVKQGQIGHNPRAYLAEGADPADAPVESEGKMKEPKFKKASLGDSLKTAGEIAGGGNEKMSNPIESGLTKFGSGIGHLLRGNKSSSSSLAGSKPYSSSPTPTGDLTNPYSAAPNLGSSLVSKPSNFGGLNPLNDRPDVAGAGARMGLGSPTFASGGKVPAMVSPGEKYLTPHQAQGVLKGHVNPMDGKTIPGKAKVKGDSYDNDIVPATLEEGGCVIPRSVLQSDQPMKNAIKFVHEHMRKMAKGGKVEHKEPVHKETEHHIVPKEVAIEVLRKPHFLFSASNPHVEPEVSMTPDQVLKALQEQGYTAEHAQGKYNDEEPSIMVHNISPEHAGHLMKLAKRLGQESAIYSSGGRHEAHYLNGPKTGMVAHGEGTEVHEHEPENFYTKTKNGLIFSHNIDWDNPRPRK